MTHIERLAGAFSALPRSPIFVFGNQKSGTTAIAALMARAADVRVTLDIPEIEGRTKELMAGIPELRAFVEWNRFRFSPPIVKEPSLTFMMSAVFEIFPEARGIFIIRDPRENIRSILNRLGISGHELLRPGDAAGRSPMAWKEIVDGSALRTGASSHIEVLALRWNRALEECERLRSKVSIMRYEDFLIDKARFIGDACLSLGLPVKTDVRGVVDVQFQPRGQKLPPNEFFGAPALEIIERVCRPNMTRFGYRR